MPVLDRLTGAIDRALLAVAPTRALERMRARSIAASLARHYEAAQGGRRTQNWSRRGTDANKASQPDLAKLRFLARDLVRNNAWAQNALEVIPANTVGDGIVPKAVGADVADIWKRWGETTDCDAAGRLNFYGLQALVMRTVVEAGEVLVRRRYRRPEDGLAIPMQLQVLEPDYIDESKDGFIGIQGGEVIQGIEHDAIGRRVAYWLFDSHPGAGRVLVSKRVDARDVLHVYKMARPGQVRGPSWLASVIVSLREFDEFEDAELMRQKIAACFAGFIVDVDGAGAPLGEQSATDPLIETLEPGMLSRLAPGQDVRFGNPPVTADSGFSVRTLRRIAAGIGITYEDLTGDYSQVNYSSGRMGWLRHWRLVGGWRWNMLVPQFCDPAWAWAMESAQFAGIIAKAPRAEWTPPPQPMIDPEKEGIAYMRRVRSGQMTPSEMVREQGRDPDAHWAEMAKDFATLDALGIVLDSDPRKVTQSGQAQAQPAPAEPADDPPEDPPA